MSENTNNKSDGKINIVVKRPGLKFGILTRLNADNQPSEWTVKVDHDHAVVVNGKAYTAITFSHEVDQMELGQGGKFARRKDGTVITRMITAQAWLAINASTEEYDLKFGTFKPFVKGGNVGKFSHYNDDSQPANLIRAMSSKNRLISALAAFESNHPIYEPITGESAKDDRPKFSGADVTTKVSDVRALSNDDSNLEKSNEARKAEIDNQLIALDYDTSHDVQQESAIDKIKRLLSEAKSAGNEKKVKSLTAELKKHTS